MKYIHDLDEMLASAPYYLGTNNQHFSVQSHEFVIDADRVVLQKVVNEQLNAPLQGGVPPTQTNPDQIPYGLARRRVSGVLGEVSKVKYVVPLAIHDVTLSMIRYWRAQPVQAHTRADQGWMAYTEALFHFPVRREIEGFDIQEAVRFVAVVYIDDSTFQQPNTDPHEVPIVLGREAFGMPKCPGDIFYCPSPHNPAKPRVKVWNNQPDQRIALADCIVFDPDDPADPAGAICSMPEALTPAAPDDPRRYSYLASEFDLDPGQIVSRVRKVKEGDHVSISEEMRVYARILEVPQDEPLLIWDDLFLYMKLVGLKQFPDPTTGTLPDGSGKPLEACYQAIVESPIEYDPGHLPVFDTTYNDQLVEFPKIDRIDLIEKLGLHHNDRRITISASNVHYMQGATIYANPGRTEVWEPA